MIEIWEKDPRKKNWLINLIKKKSKPRHRVGIFGIPYKENTTTLKNSLTLEILEKYKKNLIFMILK